MKPLSSLFGRSPFGPLVEHAKKVSSCVQLVRPMAEALIAGEYEKMEELQNRISKAEHEADLIKNGIREHLPKQFFLAVSQRDLLHFLHQQDEIADAAEDFAVILTFREMKLHPKMVEMYREFLDKVLATCEQTVSATEELGLLLEASFGGPEADKVLEIIDDVSRKEWEADRLQRKLIKRMFTLEEDLGPVNIMILSESFKALDALADASENTANNLRLMILKG